MDMCIVYCFIGTHWFTDVAEDGWSDTVIGVCVLIFALGLLIICLIAIVKLLHSLLQVGRSLPLHHLLTSYVIT